MINIVVHDDERFKPYVVIEDKSFIVDSNVKLIELIKFILDKREYSGERLCLEKLQHNGSYLEIDRWPK